MNKLELSLLLYLESRAVDHGGAVDARHMNVNDFEIAKRWDKKGYIEFGRIFSGDVGPKRHNWVILSDKAWQDAHAERRARNARMWVKRTFHKTSEL